MTNLPLSQIPKTDKTPGPLTASPLGQSLVHTGHPVTPTGRLLLGVWCLLLICGFTLSAVLQPDPRGFGTHQRLGLPPCTFLTIFKTPCPTCGMTTSFAHFVRGHFAQATQANAAGLGLALVCAVMVPWLMISVVTNRLWLVTRPDRMVLMLILLLAAVSLLQWLTRVVGSF